MASSYSIGPSSKQRKVGIFWLDSEVNNSEENLSAQQQLYNSFNNVEIFENEAQCQEFIRSNSNQPVFLIVSGQLSRKIVPAIESLGQVIGIYIYCMNESRHIDWAKGFPKIKAIITDLEKLISTIKNDLETMIKKKSIPMTVEETTPLVQPKPKPSCHLDGYEKVPLGSLEDAIAPLVNLVDDVARMAWTVKQNATNPEDGLTSDESASIGLFTLEWYPPERTFNAILNETLRSENKNLVKPWFAYLRLLFHALSKLNTVSSVVYQGTKKELTQTYQKNTTFTSWDLMICTSAISTLEEENTFGKTGQRTMFTIQCQSGKDIRRHAYDPSRDEVLLLPGRQLRAISCLSAADDLTIVQLDELESLYTFQ